MMIRQHAWRLSILREIRRLYPGVLTMTPSGTTVTSEAPEETATLQRHANWTYLVAMLTATYALNFVDRHIMNILAEPIKKDLRLQDWQLGVLTGLAFALVYGAMALPIARLADRTNRPRLITAALTIWSAGTSACSVAGGFGSLAAARITVGLGESGYTPTAHSLITEAVPKTRRTLALGIFNTGPSLGAMTALAVGGVVADLWGWRRAFLLAGLPGLVMALIVLLTVSEPGGPHRGSSPSTRTDFKTDALGLLKKKSFALFVCGGGLFGTSSYGLSAFMFSFLSRSHDAAIVDLAHTFQHYSGVHVHSVGVIGPILGIIGGSAGISSSLLSGFLADRLVARNVRYFSLVTAIPQLLAMPALVIALTTSNLASALTALAVGMVLMGFVSAPLASSIQYLASSSNRATASAISMFALIVFGNGMGPFLIGVMSDVARHWGFGQAEALRIAMLTIAMGPMSVAALLFLLAGRYLARDMGYETHEPQLN
jgi:predicted MFS family arabinose efflux permease